MTKNDRIDYLGVGRDDIIESLEQGEALIRSLVLGPAVKDILDAWQAGDPLTRLAAAQTRAELAQAMRETGSGGVFARMAPIFMYHAAVNTNGTGLRVMQDLARWGAFSGMQPAYYSEQDEEQDRYLVREFARAVLADPVMARQRAAALIDELRVKQPRQASDHEAALKSVLKIMGQKTGDASAAFAKAFDKADLRQRHLTKTLLFVMSGAAEAQALLEIPNPMMRYGVVFENLSRNFAAMAKEIGEEASARLESALDPFYQTDEVEMTGMGAITRDFKHLGLIFVASAAAAEAVAAAFPERQVIDHEGRVIRPPVVEPLSTTPKPPAP